MELKQNIIKFITGTTTLSLILFSTESWAQKPINRKGSSHVKTSLNAYSFNTLLMEGKRDSNKGISLFSLLDFVLKIILTQSILPLTIFPDTLKYLLMNIYTV